MHIKFKIAIADDHSIIREAIKILLEEKGFEVFILAENGEDLINQIKTSSELPDLCIIDHNMPIMNGSEAIDVIKSGWPGIKLIGTSLENENQKNMVAKGADDFLLKDYLPEQLYQAILNLVD